MTIIEVDKNLFVNMKQVFRIELIQVEKSDRCYIKFHSSGGEYAISREFPSDVAARDWLSLSVIRSSGSNEILAL